MQPGKLYHPTGRVLGRVSVPGSKSETNRLRVLQALYAPEMLIQQASESADARALEQGLLQMKEQDYLNVGDAGTAYRFLTAVLAVQPGRWTLDGSARMRERPVGPLVEALRQLGAQIRYAGAEAYPPLEIEGAGLRGGRVQMAGDLSSQYATALLLIGPSLPGGLELELSGQVVSAPYIHLTAQLMRRLGLSVRVGGSLWQVQPPPAHWSPPDAMAVEPDWSAASYWYLMTLLARKAEVYLPGFREHSLQGDAMVGQYFEPLGVVSHSIGAGFCLRKAPPFPSPKEINLVQHPDLAQTLAVAYAALDRPVVLKGLKTLRIKETDRLAALEKELRKTGAQVSLGEESLRIEKGMRSVEGCRFSTYGDHRMAMALAPLALRGRISIEDPGVVEKSYGRYWEDLRHVGFELE